MKSLILATLVVAACTSLPPESPEGGSILVTPLEEGRMLGGRARYTVAAPLGVVRAVVLDFDHQGEFRPIVSEARLLSVTRDGGEVMFRFRGGLGIRPKAHCVYVVTGDEEEWRLSYRMKSPGMALRALTGGFRLYRQEGGRQTLVIQEFLVSALIVNHDQLLRELRADAAAIRSECEARARFRP